eukprot:CAMPEP_0119570590 /NCGR_PEP_ID=MMETSP1352-20130426/43690_1 /TAXON_ID=265584 /ORGANISM="Stauroneis constricta, Strain CCMP1120" /LENGTH=665 /DNA_ID=CAMNT_0007620259 /DNA_START=737 /DNA_END=2735 /DNA_ORIENTATION=+
MDIPAIPADSSMPSSNDSVMSSPADALEVSILKPSDSAGATDRFNENAIIVQVDSNLSGNHQGSLPPSPQRSVNPKSTSAASNAAATTTTNSSPASATQRAVGMTINTASAGVSQQGIPSSVSGITPTAASTASASTTPTSRQERQLVGNPFDTAPSQPLATPTGNPFDSPSLKYEEQVFEAYDQQQQQQQPQSTRPLNSSLTSNITTGNGSAYRAERNPAADGFDENSHGDTVGSTVTGMEGAMNMQPSEQPETNSDSRYGRQRQNPKRISSRIRSGSLGEDGIPEGVLIDENSHGDTVGSTVTGMEGAMNMQPSEQPEANSNSRYGRERQNPKRISSRIRSGSLGEDGIPEGVLICGFLQKLGRNGKWQTRWFETDGECLSYYKSSHRTKLLATLDLAKVGSIVIDHEDPTSCAFVINISERPYRLRADGKVTCTDWVITLNRVKEARMQEGNVKLFLPNKQRKQQRQQQHQPPDLLSDNVTPRVVVVANRERTRAIDDIDSWEQAVHGQSNNNNNGNNPAAPPSDEYYEGMGGASRVSNRLARWQKPRNSMTKLAKKVLTWARSLRSMGCANAESQVALDYHVHPPGHDDDPQQRAPPPSAFLADTNANKGAAHAAWIGKETTASERMGAVAAAKKSAKSMSDSITTGDDDVGSDEEPRHLS